MRWTDISALNFEYHIECKQSSFYLDSDMVTPTDKKPEENGV